MPFSETDRTTQAARVIPGRTHLVCENVAGEVLWEAFLTLEEYRRYIRKWCESRTSLAPTRYKIEKGYRNEQAVLPIDQIIVGDRTVGLLNPITVDENGRLLAGARRLAACKRRGRPLRGRR
jgi:hypothetical protein